MNPCWSMSMMEAVQTASKIKMRVYLLTCWYTPHLDEGLLFLASRLGHLYGAFTVTPLPTVHAKIKLTQHEHFAAWAY